MAQPILIHDATIVTADGAGSIHYDAALLVQDHRIAAIGPSAELLARYPGAERVDGRGRGVFPGFANTHTHLARVLARGIYEDLSPPHRPPFTGGLAPLPLPSLTEDQERVMVQLGALEAIRSGTTLVLEEGTRLDAYAEALVATGLRLVLCERAWDRANASIGQLGPFTADAALAEAGLARIAALHAHWDGRSPRGRPTSARPSSSRGSASSGRSSTSWRRSTSTRSGARWRRSRSSAASCRRSTSRAPGFSPTASSPPTAGA